ncbi:MAG: hypothetical protein MOGMAGMI_00904 [Candidatus Omnitrophica bacterium]|nr:hypothetical protein [Candidatus Omnitrophota bacterium]
MKEQNQENQPDLFSQPIPDKKRSEPLQELRRSPQPILLHTTLEQIVFYAIVFVLYSCGVFFFGVLRGKSIDTAPAPQSLGRSPAVQRPQPVQTQTVAVDPATAPAAPVPPAVRSQTPDPAKPYTIQLLSHRRKDYADRDASAIRRGGMPTFVMRKGDYYIVCAGQYASSDEATGDLRMFRQKYRDCFLRRK